MKNMVLVVISYWVYISQQLSTHNACEILPDSPLTYIHWKQKSINQYSRDSVGFLDELNKEISHYFHLNIQGQHLTEQNLQSIDCVDSNKINELENRNQNKNYLYFHVLPSSHWISGVHSYIFGRSCWVFKFILLPGLGKLTVEEASTPNKTCQRCRKNDERPTGTNTTNWMGWRWKLTINIIPILILTEIFPSVQETWYL